MGEVYRARDTRLDRTVAVKILRSPHGDFLARFEREAKAISALQHPNICVLHDVGRDGQVDFLVMEYLEGETLAQRLARKPLSLDEALRVAIEVASALDAAHRHGVVHRDLKPGNIMLTKSGAKLMDFGLAKPQGLATGAPALSGAATITNASPITAEGVIVGTVQYMSPEQIQGREADARSDLFAFGATLYEMVSGKRAFDGKSQISVASAILEKDPAPLATLQPLTPPSLDRLVSKCLAKDPEDRWQSARDLVTELRWIEEGAHEPASKPQRRERLYGALAVAFLLAAIFGGASYWRLKSAPPRTLIAQIAPPENRRFGSIGYTGAWPAISPDGQAIAFPAVDDGGQTMLWLRSLDSVSARPLAGTEGASEPFWSPDSRALGFFADGKLKIMNVSEGAAITIAGAPVPMGGTWNAGGTILFGAEFDKGLYQVPAAGGGPARAVLADKLINASPKFLPDGKHFLYHRAGGDPALEGTYFASLDGKEPHLVIRGAAGASYASGVLLYLRGGTLTAQAFDPVRGELTGDPHPVAEHVAASNHHGLFDVSENGLLIYQTGDMAEKRLTWFDRAGKNLGPTGEIADYYDVRISPDGNRLAFNAAPGIFVDELVRAVRIKVSMDPEADHTAPAWSPDGNRIVFGAQPAKGPSGLYSKLSNGSGSEELLLPQEGARVWPSSWSRDGKFILYADQPQSTEVGILFVTGDRKPRALLKGAAVFDGQFSPDARWVAYTSRESGRDEVFLIPFEPVEASNASTAAPSGKRWQISTVGGRCARWRGDGKEIFWISPAGEITSAELKSSGNGIEVGAPHVLFRSDIPPYTTSPYDVTPDGKKFVLITPSGRSGPLTLVVNWAASLDRH
jgi:Tol biopolymer transport system component